MTPLLMIKDISSALAQYMNLPEITGGVGVYGPAAAYALVWELGSRRLKSPGPKTLWSKNRLGKKAILTKQAPHGYVTPTDEFWHIIENEIVKVKFEQARSKKDLVYMLENAMDNASHRIARVIAQRAPVDSGQLRTDIQGVDTDEADFLDSIEDADLEASGTLII